MSYLVEIDKSDVQKMAFTIAIIPCLLFAAGFLTATLSKSNADTFSASVKSNNEVMASYPDTTPTVSVISEIIEPTAAAEITEPVIAIEDEVQELSKIIETEITESVTAATETTEPAVAIEDEAPAQELSEIIETEIAESVTAATETTEPAVAIEDGAAAQELSEIIETEIAESVTAATETTEPAVAIEDGATAQKLAKVIEEAPTQPRVSNDAHQANQLFSVQVAAFQKASNAIDYAVQLKAKGYPVEVTVESNASDISVYKVLYGSFKRDEAIKSSANFSLQENTTSFIIAHL